MRNTEDTQDERLRVLAESARGLRYDSAEVAAILDGDDWSQFWPIVDRDGYLTGEITDSQGDYANVRDLAMISFDDLTPLQLESVRDPDWDGYVTLHR